MSFAEILPPIQESKKDSFVPFEYFVEDSRLRWRVSELYEPLPFIRRSTVFGLDKVGNFLVETAKRLESIPDPLDRQKPYVSDIVEDILFATQMMEAVRNRMLSEPRTENHILLEEEAKNFIRVACSLADCPPPRIHRVAFPGIGERADLIIAEKIDDEIFETLSRACGRRYSLVRLPHTVRAIDL